MTTRLCCMLTGCSGQCPLRLLFGCFVLTRLFRRCKSLSRVRVSSTRSDSKQSVFGITDVNWPVKTYFLISGPLFVVNVILCFAVPMLMARNENKRHPTDLKRIQMQRHELILLGREAPEAAKPIDPDAESSESSGRSPSHKTHRRPPFVRGRSHDHQSPSPSPSRRGHDSATIGPTSPRSPGVVVGARRKHLHADDARRDHMQFYDFQRGIEMASGASGAIALRPRHGIAPVEVLAQQEQEEQQQSLQTRRMEDRRGRDVLRGSGFFDGPGWDLERAGSQRRRRSWSIS